MDLKSIWSVLEESSEILSGGYAYPAADRAAEELALPPDFYTWATAVWLWDTKPFTVAQFMRYLPYGLAQANEERFVATVQQGYLTSDSAGVYRATELGRTTATRLMQVGIVILPHGARMGFKVTRGKFLIAFRKTTR
jgi:hypothetical protein